MKLDVLRRNPPLRVTLLAGMYAALLAGSYYVSCLLRFDFHIPPEHLRTIELGFFWTLPLKLGMLAICGQFSGLLGYFSIPDLRRLTSATLLSSLIMLTIWYATAGQGVPPRGAILADMVVSFLVLSGARLGFRMLRERVFAPQARSTGRFRRVAIIGAGDVGAMLARDLATKRGLGLLPVAFYDDDDSKWRSRIHEIPVMGSPESIIESKEELGLDEVIIAMPSASAKRVGEVVKILQKARLKFETVPSLDQLATGRVKVSQLRSVEIADLLGRPTVELDMENIRGLISGKVVMVTGAGGSIGSEMCRQIAAYNPARLLLVEQSEVQIFQIEQDMIEKGFGALILPVVADVLDEPRMRHVFERYKPAVVFHAAAHKHVPMMEMQPSEAIKNNSFGTAKVAELALEYGVERFVLISTDKAINPTNIMGASKRLAEIFLQALHAANPGRTKFMAVRFGNVLGSSGSVIPVFKKQIAAGGPVRVTHPDVTRYFMTIPEACSLVLQSAVLGSGGEIFVLDMGEPVKIVDLARQLIELSGLRPDEDIEIQFVGLRPGEKLYEELSHEGENIAPTGHPKVMRFVCTPQPLETVRQTFDQLRKDIHSTQPDKIKLLVKEAVPEYQPYLS